MILWTVPQQRLGRPAGLILEHGSQIDVPVRYVGVVALQIDRSRFCRVGVYGAGGWSGDWFIVDHFFPVQNDRDVPIDQRDVISLPLTTRSTGIFRWLDHSKDRADTL